MKLFTKDIDKKLFAQYPKGSNLEDQMVVAKIFNPYGRGTWYILNSDPEDPDYLWAIVDLMDVEMGSVSRSELENIKVPPFRLGLERDIYFDPINAKEVYDGLMKGERFEKGGEIKKGDYVIVDNPYWVASLGIEKPVRRKVSMVIDGDVFFVDGSNSQMKYVKKMEEGGEIENEQSENKQMLLNRAEGFEHHAEELEAAAKKADHIPAWVVAKAERASSDLSDITHYLDGENEQKREMEEGEEKYAEGGEIKSFDVTFYKAIKRRDGEKVEILRDREDYKGSLDQVMSKALSDFQPMDEYANIKENGKEGIVAKVKVDGSAKIFSKNYGHEVGEIKVEKIVEEKKEEEKEPKKKLFGIFKKGGEVKPYIIWVSKDGEKREMYGEYKSQRAAEMAMKKLWDSSDYKSMGNKPKDMYEKEGFYAKGGGIYSSDQVYLVNVEKDGEVKEQIRVRARSVKEAREMVEDEHESKMIEKYGDPLHFNIVEAPKMAKGGKLKVGSSVKYEGKEGKVISKKGDMYFIEVENYYPNGDTLRQVVTESEVEKMADGGEMGVDKHRIYFETFGQVMDAINDIAEENGYEVKEIFPDLSYGGVGYGETKRAKVELEWNGEEKKGKSKKREKNSLNVQIYRMPSGNYELNSYFSYEHGGVIEKYKGYDIVENRGVIEVVKGDSRFIVGLDDSKMSGSRKSSEMSREQELKSAHDYIDWVTKNKMADGGDLKGSGIGEEVRGFKVGDYFYETPSEKGKNRFYKITSIDKFYIKADDYTYEVNKDTHLIPNKVRQGYGGVSSWTRGDFEYKVDTKQLSKYNKGDLDGYSYNAEGGMMEKGGVTGDVHSLTDKMLSQKIQIFIDKVKPIKYYYIDEKSNSLVVGLDGNYTQDAADKFHKEATSSMEFFDADSVDMEYMPKTKDTQYRIKLKKPVKFASGGMMAEGGEIKKFPKNYKIKNSKGINPKYNYALLQLNKNGDILLMGTHAKLDNAESQKKFWEKNYAYPQEVDKWVIDELVYNKMADGGYMAKGGKTEEKWIQKAIHPKKKGALREEAKRLGLIKGDEKLSMDVLKKLEAKGGKTAQRARLAMKLKQFAGGGEMEMGGKVKFEDKVKSVKKSLLERKKVPKRLEKDYGKTYDPKEAEDAAKRIVGAQTYRERLEARLKKAKKK